MTHNSQRSEKFCVRVFKIQFQTFQEQIRAKERQKVQRNMEKVTMMMMTQMEEGVSIEKRGIEHNFGKWNVSVGSDSLPKIPIQEFQLLVPSQNLLEQLFGEHFDDLGSCNKLRGYIIISTYCNAWNISTEGMQVL